MKSKNFFVFRLEIISLFGTASFNKRVIRHISVGILTRLIFQVKRGGLRNDSWKYKNKCQLTRLLKRYFENSTKILFNDLMWIVVWFFVICVEPITIKFDKRCLRLRHNDSEVLLSKDFFALLYFKLIPCINQLVLYSTVPALLLTRKRLSCFCILFVSPSKSWNAVKLCFVALLLLPACYPTSVCHV